MRFSDVFWHSLFTPFHSALCPSSFVLLVCFSENGCFHPEWMEITQRRVGPLSVPAAYPGTCLPWSSILKRLNPSYTPFSSPVESAAHGLLWQIPYRALVL